MELPKDIRPQLTGHYVCRDLGHEESYPLVLDAYRRYQEAKTEPERSQAYQHFRRGLDTLDLDFVLYQILGMNRTSIGHWLPAIVRAAKDQDFFKIPQTTVIRVPMNVLQLTRLEYEGLNRTTLRIIDEFCMEVFGLDTKKNYFVKNGVYSSKFDFRNAKVAGEKEVHELGEYLLFIHHQAVMMASYLVQPSFYGPATTNEWVVREYIADTEKNPCIYKGMPLHTEYRLFADFDTGEFLGMSPYWRPDVMKKRFGHETDAREANQMHDYIVYQMHEETLMRRYDENKTRVQEAFERIIPRISLSGQWSVDILQNGDDFYIIDLAPANLSALSDCVPEGKIKKSEEKWIPDFKGEWPYGLKTLADKK